MRTAQEIRSEISQIEKELSLVEGSKTEVYSRIVGYYRSVKNWNKGKLDEYYRRKTYVVGMNGNVCEVSNLKRDEVKSDSAEIEKVGQAQLEIHSYLMFTRKTCPNCPPVKEYMKNFVLAGVAVDVDTDEGLALAKELDVYKAPTVVFFDSDRNEIARAFSVHELTQINSLEKVS